MVSDSCKLGNAIPGQQINLARDFGYCRGIYFGFILTWLAAAAPFGITNPSRTAPTSLTRKPPVSDFVADLSKENRLRDAEISRGQAVDLFT